MPLSHKKAGWYWGSKGPFPTKAKALSVARAIHANESIEESIMNKFVLELLHGVTNTHILHLQSRSFSEHSALGAFYDGLDDLVDSLVEAYQGKYGIIEGYEASYQLPAPALEYLIGLSDYVASTRSSLPQDSELQNIIDEIAALIDSTVYKLRFLK